MAKAPCGLFTIRHTLMLWLQGRLRNLARSVRGREKGIVSCPQTGSGAIRWKDWDI